MLDTPHGNNSTAYAPSIICDEVSLDAGAVRRRGASATSWGGATKRRSVGGQLPYSPHARHFREHADMPRDSRCRSFRANIYDAINFASS